MDLTSRLLLSKPDSDPVTGDFVDIDVLNANFDALDAAIGFAPATSTARPTTPFQGQPILESDTSNAYVWGGSGWVPLLTGPNVGIGTQRDANTARKLKLLHTGSNGSLSQVLIEQTGAATGSRALSVKAGGEANERWWLDFDGKMQWGPGTAGGDITLQRSAAGVLDVSTGTLTVGGSHPAVAGNFGKWSSNGTWTKPAKARWVRVRLVGGGGAGGGSVAVSAGAGHSKGGGGGSGAYAEKWFDAVDLPATVAVTVGAGGTGVSGAAGNAGGTSSFGTYLSASGGGGGFIGTASTATYEKNGGVGGNTFTGAPDLQVPGQVGGKGGGGGSLGSGGVGAPSFWGGGGAGAETLSSPASVAGGDAPGWGGGGGGSATNQGGAANVGGDGKGGLVIVETYY